MKEIELKHKDKDSIEISVNQKKQIEYELINNIVPHEGHTIFEINKETLEVKAAKFSNTTYKFGEQNKKEIIVKDGYAYVSALNKKNALKNYKNNKLGGKVIEKEPLKLLY